METQKFSNSPKHRQLIKGGVKPLYRRGWSLWYVFEVFIKTKKMFSNFLDLENIFSIFSSAKETNALNAPTGGVAETRSLVPFVVQRR